MCIGLYIYIFLMKEYWCLPLVIFLPLSLWRPCSNRQDVFAKHDPTFFPMFSHLWEILPYSRKTALRYPRLLPPLRPQPHHSVPVVLRAPAPGFC